MIREEGDRKGLTRTHLTAEAFRQGVQAGMTLFSQSPADRVTAVNFRPA